MSDHVICVELVINGLFPPALLPVPARVNCNLIIVMIVKMQCKLLPFYHDDDDDDDDGNDDLFKANNELIPLVVSTFVASH